MELDEEALRNQKEERMLKTMMIQRQVWNDKVRYLIADEHGSVMLELYNGHQQWGEHYGTAWIWGLYIFPHSRRKGHARRLLEEVEHIVAKAGHKDVYQ